MKINWQSETFCECPKNSPPNTVGGVCDKYLFVNMRMAVITMLNVDDRLMYVDKDDDNDTDGKNDDDNDEDLTAASV